MFNDLQLEARVMINQIGLSIRRILANRAMLISNMGGMILNNLLFFVTWVLIFQLTSDIRGWTLSDVAMMYGLGATSFGLACMLWGGFRQLAVDIETGRFDTFLAKPVSPFTLMLTSYSHPSSWGDAATGIVFWLLFCKLSVLQFLFLLFAALNGGIICAAFGVVIYSSAFWLSNVRNQVDVVLFMIISFLTTPLHGMPTIMKIVLFTVIPAGFVSYLPVEVIRHPSVDKVVYMILGMICSVIVARWVFARGLNMYKGASGLSAGL